MRLASAVQTDTKNILEERYKGFINELTDAIEKACQQGKYRAVWTINTDNEGKAYLIDRLKGYGYTASAVFSQRDNGFNFEIKWDKVDGW